jgi:RimJ/RimL family protein N-acetyltransferase
LAAATTTVPALSTARLRLDAFVDSDVAALAAILAEPEVTRNITADASTPERCLATAAARIAWHNGSWAKHGYGVWALREAEFGALLGWCGFAEPDIGSDPEVLYGLAPACWGRGLATEAATAAIDWLFRETAEAGVSAVIFGRLNAASATVLRKLGMRLVGTMAMAEFLPDRKLARSVVDYETWRLGQGASNDPDALLFQAPFKAGQIATLLDEPSAIEWALCHAALQRPDYGDIPPGSLARRVREAFRAGMSEPSLDWYHVGRGPELRRRAG